MNLKWDRRADTLKSLMIERYKKQVTDPITGEIYHFHTLTLSSKANQEDYPTLKEILRMLLEEQEAWYEAMHKEMEGLLQKECYELVD